MERNLPEILAPAGNAESLRAAVSNGANAVYLGLKDFSARAKASNFSLDELSDAIAYAHIFGVKVYIAFNTLIKNSEMKSAIEQIETAAKIGADAFIIQDLGLLNEIRNLTDVPLHASTQMGIHNLYGAEAAKKCGFDRIILSRECTLDDIREIKNNVDIEVETFVQGALCVAFSGNCLFSSLVSGYSGNRGKCLQLCRKKYELDIGGRKSDGYYLSAKDLCLLSDLKSLRDAGVDSFKIEGRMRRSEYVGESVSVYRTLIDNLGNTKAIDDGAKRLKRIFNRGDYCNGYLTNPTANVIFPTVQGHKGVKIGTVERVTGKKLLLHTSTRLKSGDGLKFVNESGETGGCLVSDPKNIVYDGNVKKGDEVCLTTDIGQMDKIRARDKKIELFYKIILRKNQPIKAIVSFEGGKKAISSDFIVQEAKTAPINAVGVHDIFSKSTVPYFKIDSAEVTVDDNVFVPIGLLKEFKRRVEKEVAAVITDKNYLFEPRKNYGATPYPFSLISQNFGSPENILFFDSENFIERFRENEKIDAFVYSPKDYSDYNSIERVLTQSCKPIFLNIPIMARSKDLLILKKISDMPCVKNIVANNLYALELFSDKNILLGSGLNIINDFVEGEKIASLERDEVSDKVYTTVFSRVPVMTFAHCPYKSFNGKCVDNCRISDGKLTDERGNVFPIDRYKINYCYAQLKNNIPLLLEEEAEKKKLRKRIYDFRGYSAEFAEKLLSGNFSNLKHTHFNYNKKLR